MKTISTKISEILATKSIAQIILAIFLNLVTPFVRPHLDYIYDNIYDEAFNTYFHSVLEPCHCYFSYFWRNKKVLKGKILLVIRFGAPPNSALV